MTSPKQQRVVILGGGFAGVYTARGLARLLRRRTDVEVELLSEENYFVFQPLLPEVAAGGINPNHVVAPIRDLVPRVRFRWCRVAGVDTARQCVNVLQGEGRALVEVPYDHLVFALGKVSDFSSMPGVNEHSLPLKDLDDAFRMRNHVFRCLELADIESDASEKQALLTFVVAGGGFSGVETIGELSELLRKCVSSFGNIDISEVRMHLIHSRDVLLPEMDPGLGKAAERILRKRGVDLLMDSRVRAATRHGVYLSTDQFLPTRTFVCTVGNAANPVVKKVLVDGGFQEGEVKGRGVGVFATDLTLACTGKPGYWAVGDNAGIPDAKNPGELCPPTAQFAIREAEVCARNILAAIDGRPLEEFRFRSLGMLASLGQRRGVADVMGFRFSGFAAWSLWRGFYLMTLPGMAQRLRVSLDWMLDLFFPRDIAQIQTGSARRLHIQHFEPGETIIREGEIGRELFIMKKGDVEVFHPADGDKPERTVAMLKRGDVFGERALIDDTPRVASVRAKSAVDVLMISREDFDDLVRQFPVLDDYFERLMRERYPGEAASGLRPPASDPSRRFS